ncbi:hypothetical protein JKP88DRAFT_273095 [Tribonema minus]|uniref:Uncharacterized protein n=1 Tax=Tribonema minus TaxID=303371 RepID=A0A835YYL3_9STRA|nr:hypothetical protein JKP88DRAFT_273095 [Tribonema minus]
MSGRIVTFAHSKLRAEAGGSVIQHHRVPSARRTQPPSKTGKPLLRQSGSTLMTFGHSHITSVPRCVSAKRVALRGSLDGSAARLSRPSHALHMQHLFAEFDDEDDEGLGAEDVPTESQVSSDASSRYWAATRRGAGAGQGAAASLGAATVAAAAAAAPTTSAASAAASAAAAASSAASAVTAAAVAAASATTAAAVSAAKKAFPEQARKHPGKTILMLALMAAVGLDAYSFMSDPSSGTLPPHWKPVPKAASTGRPDLSALFRKETADLFGTDAPDLFRTSRIVALPAELSFRDLSGGGFTLYNGAVERVPENAVPTEADSSVFVMPEELAAFEKFLEDHAQCLEPDAVKKAQAAAFDDIFAGFDLIIGPDDRVLAAGKKVNVPVPSSFKGVPIELAEVASDRGNVLPAVELLKEGFAIRTANAAKTMVTGALTGGWNAVLKPAKWFTSWSVATPSAGTEQSAEEAEASIARAAAHIQSAVPKGASLESLLAPLPLRSALTPESQAAAVSAAEGALGRVIAGESIDWTPAGTGDDSGRFPAAPWLNALAEHLRMALEAPASLQELNASDEAAYTSAMEKWTATLVNDIRTGQSPAEDVMANFARVIARLQHNARQQRHEGVSSGAVSSDEAEQYFDAADAEPLSAEPDAEAAEPLRASAGEVPATAGEAVPEVQSETAGEREAQGEPTGEPQGEPMGESTRDGEQEDQPKGQSEDAEVESARRPSVQGEQVQPLQSAGAPAQAHAKHVSSPDPTLAEWIHDFVTARSPRYPERPDRTPFLRPVVDFVTGESASEAGRPDGWSQALQQSREAFKSAGIAAPDSDALPQDMARFLHQIMDEDAFSRLLSFEMACRIWYANQKYNGSAAPMPTSLAPSPL